MPENHIMTTEKKTYTKPTVTEVRLVAQEAVLANCKNVGLYDTCVNSQGDITCANPDGTGWTAHS